MIYDVAVFTRLKYWVQMALPLVYDDSLSYMELLAKVVEKLNELGEDYNELVEQIEESEHDYKQLVEDVAILNEEMEKVKNGDYVSAYIPALSQWIDDNLQEMVEKVVKFVQFGLTDSGYFEVTIPDNWDFLQFSTIYDTTDPNYMHLVIEY